MSHIRILILLQIKNIYDDKICSKPAPETGGAPAPPAIGAASAGAASGVAPGAAPGTPASFGLNMFVTKLDML